MTRVIFKTEVRMRYINPAIGHAIDVARDVWEILDIDECVVTSLNDSYHSKTSLHYAGCAVDLRIRNVPTEHRDTITHMLRQRLGSEYDVLNEGDHYHIEWQPKRED